LSFEKKFAADVTWWSGGIENDGTRDLF